MPRQRFLPTIQTDLQNIELQSVEERAFQKAVIQTARHPARPKAEAPDRQLENPANPNPGEVFRQF